MNTWYTSHLLRRTAAVFAAVAGFHVAADSQAAQISLSSGGTCTFGTMNVTPAGNLEVQCTGSSTGPGPAGTFALSGGALALQVSTSSSPTNQLTVSRAGGTTDQVTVSYSIASASSSCTPMAAGTLTFNNGSSTSQAIPVTATATAGTCDVTISAPTIVGTQTATTAPTLGLLTATVTVTAAPPPPPPGTCPTPPANMVTADLGWPGLTTRIALLSGQVVSFPAPPARTTGISNVVRIAETVTTPNQSFLEVTLSKCPGVIDSTAGGGRCYIGSYVTNLNELVYYYNTAGARNENWIRIQGACYAPIGDGVWFVNARWTYAFSPYGTGQYVFQWGNGPY